ncbi:MAG: hypothetical protein AAF125_03380 [Chloroflexota bacterium]
MPPIELGPDGEFGEDLPGMTPPRPDYRYRYRQLWWTCGLGCVVLPILLILIGLTAHLFP